ncbi:hypothetical protein H6789_02680 [Candidatus Nomurabacteria bacterium]|nr:hypothetical protein [Candidatus Kaiserbacteria bacterium]MCB9815360.1 hypothetical protein [Candidatus Nomurabacteria bacterium]MCB9819582.1 hypothetical protein [Candidatus Nomurabacteria bacterium]
MELSLFLAQLFGLTMIIFTLVALFRPSLIEGVMKDIKTPSLVVLMTGFAGVLGGLAVILNHNIWEFSWVGLITFFGWAALLKGISFIAFPKFLSGIADKVFDGGKIKWVLTIALLAGCYLAYNGFGLGA